MKFSDFYWKNLGQDLLIFLVLGIILDVCRYYYRGTCIDDFLLRTLYLTSLIIFAVVCSLVESKRDVKKYKKEQDDGVDTEPAV